MTDVKPVAVPVPASGRKLRIALAVSVALNLAVASVAAGAFLRQRADGPHKDIVRELGFGPYAEALGREDRRALRQAFLARAPAMGQVNRQRRDDAAAVLQALRATPFVADALTALMAEQQQRMTQQLALGQVVLQDFLINMAPQDRAAFADRLEEQLKRPRQKEAPNP